MSIVWHNKSVQHKPDTLKDWLTFDRLSRLYFSIKHIVWRYYWTVSKISQIGFLSPEHIARNRLLKYSLAWTKHISILS